MILASSWARHAILVAGKGRGRMFLFLLFLHFHSCSSFFPVPLFHLIYYLFCLFSPFLWETTQNGPQGLTLRWLVTTIVTQSLQDSACCQLISFTADYCYRYRHDLSWHFIKLSEYVSRPMRISAATAIYYSHNAKSDLIYDLVKCTWKIQVLKLLKSHSHETQPFLGTIRRRDMTNIQNAIYGTNDT